MKHSTQAGSSILLHGGEGMSVDSKGDLDALVAQALLNYLDRNSCLKQKGPASVPEAVKFDRAHAGLTK